MTAKIGEKILSLESLRGLAALVVVFDHFFRTFYPFTFVSTRPSHSNFEWYFSHTPLFVAINGAFAVMIFFVLSGFVLSYGFFKRPEKFDYVSAVVKRYFRLTPIVLVSILAAFILLKLHLFFNTQAGLMPESWKKDVDLLSALWEGFIGVYVTAPDASSLNSVLWTIYYEMIGSIFVFALLAMIGRDRRRGFVYAFLAVILIGTNFIGFLIGLILADIYQNKRSIYESIANQSVFYKLIALTAALYMASFPPLRTAEDLGLAFRPMLFLNNYSLNQTIVHLIAAAIIIILLLTSRRLNRFLELRPLVFLGAVSYSMYATHLLVLGSVVSFVFYMATQNGWAYNNAAAIAALVYIPTVLIVATLVTKYVDKPAIALSRASGRFILARHAQKPRATKPSTSPMASTPEKAAS